MQALFLLLSAYILNRLAFLAHFTLDSIQTGVKMYALPCYNTTHIEEGNILNVPSKCTHKFHRKCLLPWLEQHGACPCCRVVMVSDEELIEKVYRLYLNRDYAVHPPRWQSQSTSAERGAANTISRGQSRHTEGTMEDVELGAQQTQEE